MEWETHQTHPKSKNPKASEVGDPSNPTLVIPSISEESRTEKRLA